MEAADFASRRHRWCQRHEFRQSVLKDPLVCWNLGSKRYSEELTRQRRYVGAAVRHFTAI